MNKGKVFDELQETQLYIFKFFSKRYKDLGLNITPAQSKIIISIYEKGEQCQRQLESFVTCNKSTLSSILDTMEKNGYIVRKDSKDDCRKKIITLTDKAIDVVNILSDDSKKILDSLSKDISDEECLIFSSVLNKIIKNMERI